MKQRFHLQRIKLCVFEFFRLLVFSLMFHNQAPIKTLFLVHFNAL